MESSRLPSRWDETTDVLIIGSGFAGLAAAIEAKNAGSSLIIIEKMKGRGGIPSSAMVSYQRLDHCCKRRMELKTHRSSCIKTC